MLNIDNISKGFGGQQLFDAAGFQQLVAEVSLGHAGIVLGLDVSRLARNSADWQRLFCQHRAAERPTLSDQIELALRISYQFILG